MDNTFTTPVYNGSTSLRNAAGQLIENVVKSVRRKETVDDAYMTRLYADVTSLYGEAACLPPAVRIWGPCPPRPKLFSSRWAVRGC